MVQTNHKTSQVFCPDCDIGPFTRNHYFTGKLLVEADFTDEQHYHIEKLRLHEQRLHGWGVVCGLKVKQHPTCPDRFVCIEPGTAIDCCGHEIVVREQECFDITKLDAIKALKSESAPNPDPTPVPSHRLQICLRYRECPIEEIPVLYDDCGCDDTRCAPNRILESYDIDVLVDPPKTPDDFDTPRLQWENTVNIAHVSRVALHDATHSLYVLVGNTVYKVSTDNNAIESPALALPANGVELAVSNDGTRLYVATEPSSNTATNLQLFIYDTANLGNPSINTNGINIEGTASGDEVYLAVVPAPDNRLFALVPKAGNVLVWATDINTSANPATPTKVGLQATNLAGLAISSDGKYAYATDAAHHSIRVLDVSAMAVPANSPITVLPASPSALATVSSTGPDLLAVADHDNKQLYLVDPNITTPALLGSVSLTYNPLDMVASPGGHWVYVLEQDGTTKTSYVQAVNVHQVLVASPGQTIQPTEAIKIGNDSERLVLSKSGRRLYVPYVGDPTSANDGGVAILAVSEQACDDILWRQLEGCPYCDIANCVVLAIIENYVYGDKIEDQTDPPADPATDKSNQIARIDNRTGRRLLPSTQVLTEVVECLLENGTGGTGTQGPAGLPGQKGADGLGIDAVNATIVACTDPGSAQIQVIGTQRTLVLEIPRGCDAVLPPPVKYTHICGINWKHGGEISLQTIKQQGLLIAFDGLVHNEDIHRHSFMVLKEGRGNSDQGTVTNCWCEVNFHVPAGNLGGGNFETPCKVSSVFTLAATSVPFVNGAIARFNPDFDGGFVPGTYRVVVRGDYIRDTKGRAVDADHLPGWLPQRPTGDGVEGGTFNSWFTIT